MKAVIYTRVSTQRQAEEGMSMDAQKEKARAWAQSADMRIVGEFRDNGISGSRADNRPGLQAALELACSEQAALVVYSLSRLARSTHDALEIAERLDRAGADLVSLTERIDTTSAAGKMVFRMLAVLSEFERDLISERTCAALDHRKANGKKCGGPMPYGYRSSGDSGEIEPDLDEQRTILWIQEARKSGKSYRWICSQLEAQGIRPRKGRHWWPQTVKRIIETKGG